MLSRFRLSPRNVKGLTLLLETPKPTPLLTLRNYDPKYRRKPPTLDLKHADASNHRAVQGELDKFLERKSPAMLGPAMSLFEGFKRKGESPTKAMYFQMIRLAHPNYEIAE